MDDDARELLATLLAYEKVAVASWAWLRAGIEPRAKAWRGMDAPALEAELTRLVKETEQPGREVRVFWKIGPDLVYRGCNVQFARDAGFPSPAALIGKNDFDPRISWLRQSAKYRKDDVTVVETGSEKLDIIERQDSADGTIWLRTGKAPIRPAGRAAIGVLGMYEVIDAATAKQLTRSQR